MPDPQIIHHISLIATFILLLLSFNNKIYFASAYLIIIVMRPGLYYPMMGQFRFELIIALWAVLLLLSTNNLGALLSKKRSKI